MATREGSHSVRGKRRHGLGWVPWLALLLIVVLAVAVVLVVSNVSDENDDPGIDITDDEPGSQSLPASRTTSIA